MEKRNALKSFTESTGLEPDLAAQILAGKSYKKIHTLMV